MTSTLDAKVHFSCVKPKTTNTSVQYKIIDDVIANFSGST